MSLQDVLRESGLLEATQLAPDSFDVALITIDGSLHFCYAIQILLIVTRFSANLVRLAVVVLLEQLGLARFCTAQFLFKDGLCIGVSRTLLW